MSVNALRLVPMTLPLNEWRQRLVREAIEWVGTPYHHMGRVKGEHGGVDCAMLLAEVGQAVGVCPRVDVDFYPMQWNLHQRRELLKEIVERYCFQVIDDDICPGDICLVWYGKTYAHTLIVIDWPTVVHASIAVHQVELADASLDEHLRRCNKLFYRPNVWKDLHE